MRIIPWSKLEEEYKIPRDKFNVYQLIEKKVVEQKNSLALHFEYENGKKEEFSYFELDKKVNQFAFIFSKYGIKKGSRVAIFLPKCPEIYFSILATIKLGAIAIPLFEAFQKDGLKLRLEKADANFLITNKELFKRYEKIKTIKKVFIVNSKNFKNSLKEKNVETKIVEKKAPCFMIFTSSTAGTPVAGILLPHQGAVQWLYTGKIVLDLSKEKKYFCSAHPAWVTGSIYGVLTPFLLGASVFSIEGRFDSVRWKNFLLKNKISHVYTAPTVFRLLKNEIKKEDLKYIKRICSVGEALPLSLVEHYEKLGVKIIDSYWQTEIGAIAIANIDFKKGSMGKAINLDIKTIENEIVIKKPWPALMVGIWKHKKMFESYFKKDLFFTKDLAKKEKECFYFIGRKDDIIKTSGERVSPLEIENVLLKLKEVKECAVVGVPDELKGSVLKAFIVLNKEIKESEGLKDKIIEFVKKNYAGHSYPKIIEFVKELPKGNSGKILRKFLVK